MNDTLVDQPTSAPTPKLIAGTLTGAAATVAIWVADAAHVELPPAVASAIAVLAAAGVAYFKRNRSAGQHAA